MIPKTVTVNDSKLTIWISADGIVISDCGGWICGVYDDELTAIEAYKLTLKPHGWGILNDLNNAVVREEKRLITIKDIKKVRND